MANQIYFPRITVITPFLHGVAVIFFSISLWVIAVIQTKIILNSVKTSIYRC